MCGRVGLTNPELLEAHGLLDAIPSWAKDPKIGNAPANARAETVAGKPSFRTGPNRLLAQLHDRMPLIVPREHYDAWLDPETPLDDARPPAALPAGGDARVRGQHVRQQPGPRRPTRARAAAKRSDGQLAQIAADRSELGMM
jgi:putative SOS response-associated peptidase YedK